MPATAMLKLSKVPSEISRAHAALRRVRIDVVEALEVGGIFDVAEQRQRVAPRRLGRLRVGGVDDGKLPSYRGHGSGRRRFAEGVVGKLPRREFLLFDGRAVRRPPGPQAPIIEDPLYGKDSADYVAFSSSCQPQAGPAAAKGPGQKTAIP
jgi:hypothetical protein